MSLTLEKARQLQDELVAMRRHLHAHPELNFVEYETSRYAADRLEKLGFDVRSVGGKTGLVADFGSSGKLVAVRVDMDALPIGELNRAVYASKNHGIMHACGHDAHLSIALGVAQILSSQNLSGRLRLIVQPGDDEKGKPGAATMIEAQVLKGVSAVLGVHVDATIGTGKVGIVANTARAIEQTFSIEFDDNGVTDEFIDTSLASANIVRSIYGIPALLGSISDETTLTVDSLVCQNKVSLSSVACPANDPRLAGARQAKISGALKTFSLDSRQKVQEELEKICLSVRPQAVLRFEDVRAEAVDNSVVTRVMTGAAVDLLGANNVLSIKRKSWNSQFSLLTEHVPGSMIYLGAEIASSRRSHQSATFDIDENCLSIGVAVLAETVIRLHQ